ncbi:hypothetical protein D910_07241, partial [Dendroctonus ponderosae]
MFVLKNQLSACCYTGLQKRYCTKAVEHIVKGICELNPKKPLGQPAPHTHGHLLGENEVTPLIKKEEYQCRRQKLVEAIVGHARKNNAQAQNHMIVIPSTSKQYMSDKIPYVFRQNSEFIYLTGCQEPDTCAVITTGNNSCDHKTTLFTRDKDDHAELWDGPRTHPEDAVGFFGVDNSLPMSDLPKFLNSCRKSIGNISLWYDFESAPHKEIHRIVCDYLKDSCNKAFDSPR